MNYKVIKKDGLEYYQDENGTLHGEGYDNAWDFVGELALVEKPEYVRYYINKDFEIVSGPYRFACDFHDGVASIENFCNEWYYINKNFEIVGGPYNAAHDFNDGFATVRKHDDGKHWYDHDQQWYYINKNFEIVGGPYWIALDFNNGVALAEDNNRLYYFINQNLEIVGPFESANEFGHDGIASVIKLGDEHSCYINRNFEIFESYSDAINAHITMNSKKQNQSQNIIDRYLNGEIDIYRLPDECFVGDNLNIIIDNEKKTYEYLINMASTEEQKNKIQKDFEDRADFYQGRAFKVSQDKTTEK